MIYEIPQDKQKSSGEDEGEMRLDVITDQVPFMPEHIACAD